MAQQMYILSLAADGEEDENTGAYSIVDDLGNETIFLFEEDEDAERYSSQLEELDHPRLKVVEVDGDLVKKVCEFHDYNYVVISSDDIITPPKFYDHV